MVAVHPESALQNSEPQLPESPQKDASTSSRLTLEEDRFNRSCCSKIANNEYFQNLTLSIITFNALWIGIDTEWNHAKLASEDGTYKLEPVSTYIEHFFCAYFTLEVLLRFFSYKKKRYIFTDAWFLFDTMLVFFMVLETWILLIVEKISGSEGGSFLSQFSALRLLRLLRLTRMARLMRFVPELMMLCKGIIQATSAVFFIMLFLVLVTYVFAIIFTSTFGEPGHELAEGAEDPDAKFIFGSMGDSMMSLFTYGVLGDNLNWAMATILAESVVMFWLFFLFFAISSMTLLNMLIGVLCEVIGGTASDEKTTLQEYEIRVCLQQAFHGIDMNSDGKVSEVEWHHIREDPKLRQSFLNAGWDPERLEQQLEDVQHAIFKKRIGREPISLDLDELCTKVIEVRPGKPASLLDLQRMRGRQEAQAGMVKLHLIQLEEDFKQLLTVKDLPIPDLNASFESLDGRSKGNMTMRPDDNPVFQGVSTQQILRALKGKVSPGLSTAAPPGIGAPGVGTRSVPNRGGGAVTRGGSGPQNAPARGGASPGSANNAARSAPAQSGPAQSAIEPIVRSSPPSRGGGGGGGPPPLPRPPTDLQLLSPDLSDREDEPNLPFLQDLSVPSPERDALFFNTEPDLQRESQEAMLAGNGGDSNESPNGNWELSSFEDASNRRVDEGPASFQIAVPEAQTDSFTGVRGSKGARKAKIYSKESSSPDGGSEHRRGHGSPTEGPSNRRRHRNPAADNSPGGGNNAFSMVAAKTWQAGNGRMAVFEVDPDLAREESMKLVQHDRDAAQSHPLFRYLAGRSPPGGWAAARCVAAQLEACPSALVDLSKRTRIRTISELQSLLLELPEFFDVYGEPLMAEIRFPEMHLYGCPWHEHEADGDEDGERYRPTRCHCVWRLCDALQQSGGRGPEVSGGLWAQMSPKIPPRSKEEPGDNKSRKRNGSKPRANSKS